MLHGILSTLATLNTLQTVLFALAIISINPWGGTRGEVWTKPKVFVVALITFVNLMVLWTPRSVKLSWFWKISLLLWGLFLGIGSLTTFHSPFPVRSLMGQNTMGDGLLYWIMIAVFTLSNALLLKLHPELIRAQMDGLLIGGIILALSVFPQALDWHIDYTATSGRLGRPGVLLSTIYQNQQPIGLYSHRGHAAFVLAETGVLAVVAYLWKWLSVRLTAMTLALVIPALLLTQTRAGILALLAGVAFLLGRKHHKLLVPAALIGLLVVGIATVTRHGIHWSLVQRLTSDRAYLWELSTRGISKQPVLGWGFDGFGVAYPYIRDRHWTPTAVIVSDFDAQYLDAKGHLHVIDLLSTKAHNLVLDMALSTGILGLLSYLALLGFYFFLVVKSPYRGIGAVGIAYLVFTFTWFESAQFTHIAFWSFSLAEASRKHV